ncbi:MAG: LytTR family DNA-binding domain-containing protein [Bacteroidetes bacterium]|jgi:two-component system LytT family response regulator|nr:LytTR family DNA-binding domain-containing protein [Bacteroidota bacterium]
MIKAVIIDDEPAMQEVNSRLLNEYFPEIKILGTADSVETGIRLIQNVEPDLVLLDIEIKGGSGFQILQQLRPYTFKVFFITAFGNYAIKAIKFSAHDYIMKPVNETEFQQAIEQTLADINKNTNNQIQANILMDTYRKEMQSKKLVLKTIDSLHIVDIRDIIFCQSDNSYTTFYLDNNEKIVVSKSIKEYVELLQDYSFFRPHQSFLVNLNHVKKIDKSDGGFIIMKNKKEIPISLRQKKQFISLLEQL